MAITSQIAMALVAVIVLVNLPDGSAMKMKRAAYPDPDGAAAGGAGGAGSSEAGKSGAWDPKNEKWTPVREPKEFKVNVADGIEGANQLRQEKWDNGAVTGMYAQPLADKKWQVISYIADAKGYRVTSTKIVEEAELPGIEAAAAKKGNNAKIDIEQNGDKTSYKVSPDQIAPKEKEEAKSAAGDAKKPNKL